MDRFVVKATSTMSQMKLTLIGIRIEIAGRAKSTATAAADTEAELPAARAAGRSYSGHTSSFSAEPDRPPASIGRVQDVLFLHGLEEKNGCLHEDRDDPVKRCVSGRISRSSR